MHLSALELHVLTTLRLADPHALLGMHPMRVEGVPGVIVRALLPAVERVELLDDTRGGAALGELVRIEGTEVFERFIPGREVFAYRFRTHTRLGDGVREIHDPYCFLPTIADAELYFFNEGTETHAYEKLGAHRRDLGGVRGVAFTVWAPSARRVSVVGDFNDWDGRRHMMRRLGATGVWEIFVPEVACGAKYKFELLGPTDDAAFLKTDPYGAAFERRPYSAAIVCDFSGHAWTDAEWVRRRETRDWQREPISVYEVHLGSWRRRAEEGDRQLTYDELAHELADYCVETGFTHVELMPVSEHPYEPSWGYQVTGYFAPNHRFGDPQGFMRFVDALHRRGIGVLVDWVPAHFPRDEFALAGFDGSHLYDHQDPRLGAHMEWGTLIFNYDRDEVRSFLISSAMMWMDRYHIDGLRVDAVTSMLYLDYARRDGEWLPNVDGGNLNYAAIRFLRRVNEAVHAAHPGALMIAEESTSFSGVTHPVASGGLGFDFKWNMGWMHDSLAYMKLDPLARKWMHGRIGFAMFYQYTESFVLALSHDEVVHGKSSLFNKMPQRSSAERARNLRALYAYMWTWPGKKTLFMGGEFGQTSEWADAKSLDWDLLRYKEHSGIRTLVTDLNALYRSDREIAAVEQRPEGFEWVDADDCENSVYTYLRRDAAGRVWWLVVCNFTPVTRDGYRVGVPHTGAWSEVLHSDAPEYGGARKVATKPVVATATPWNRRPNSVLISIPGNSVTVFRHVVPVKP